MNWGEYTILNNKIELQNIMRDKFNVAPSDNNSELYNQMVGLINQYGPDTTVPELLKAHPDREAFVSKCKCKKKSSSYKSADQSKCNNAFKKLEEIKNKMQSGRYTPEEMQSIQAEMDAVLNELKTNNCQPQKPQNNLLEKLKQLDKQYNLKTIGIAVLITYLVVK